MAQSLLAPVLVYVKQSTGRGSATTSVLICSKLESYATNNKAFVQVVNQLVLGIETRFVQHVLSEQRSLTGDCEFVQLENMATSIVMKLVRKHSVVAVVTVDWIQWKYQIIIVLVQVQLTQLSDANCGRLYQDETGQTTCKTCSIGIVDHMLHLVRWYL